MPSYQIDSSNLLPECFEARNVAGSTQTVSTGFGLGSGSSCPCAFFTAGESHMMSELNVLFLWGESEDAELEPSDE